MQIRNFVGNKMSGGQVGHTAAEGNGELSNDDFVPLENIFALGDCCANTENPLPALAQVWGLANTEPFPSAVQLAVLASLSLLSY